MIFQGRERIKLVWMLIWTVRIIPALLLYVIVTFNEPWSCEIVTNRIERDLSMSIRSLGEVDMELVRIS